MSELDAFMEENIRPRMLCVFSVFFFEVSDTLVWLRHDAKIILLDPLIGLISAALMTSGTLLPILCNEAKNCGGCTTDTLDESDS